MSGRESISFNRQLPPREHCRPTFRRFVDRLRRGQSDDSFQHHAWIPGADVVALGDFRHAFGAGARLVIVSASSQEPYFQREFSHPQITLEDLPERFSRIEGHLISLRQYMLMNPSLGGTLNFKNEAFRRDVPKRYWLSCAANMVLGRIPPLRHAYMAAERRLFGGGEYDDLLRRHRPDLIVTGTPGYHRNDIHLLRSCRLGIPTATVMLSWDNLTSKGYMGAVPDKLLVWSDLMAGEAVKYHDYPVQIRWCGAAQFDHYHGFRDRFDRAAWRA